MHNAKLTSNRLQRVLQCLKQRPMTTLELIQKAGVCAVNSIIAELRANGLEIDCRCLRKGIFEYSLVDGNYVKVNVEFPLQPAGAHIFGNRASDGGGL